MIESLKLKIPAKFASDIFPTAKSLVNSTHFTYAFGFVKSLAYPFQ